MTLPCYTFEYYLRDPPPLENVVRVEYVIHAHLWMQTEYIC